MITNETRKQLIIGKVKHAKSWLSKAIGLMFKFKVDYGLVFVFNTENKLNFHMLFMFFPIDMLFLDSKLKITKIIHAKPWQIGLVGHGKYVIELPFRTTAKVGDKISFK